MTMKGVCTRHASVQSLLLERRLGRDDELVAEVLERVLGVELLGKGERIGVGRELGRLAAAEPLDKGGEICHYDLMMRMTRVWMEGSGRDEMFFQW